MAMLAQHDTVVTDLRARLARVQAAMAERGLGGLLLYESGQRIRRAAAIADEGFAALCEAAEVGLREHELAAAVESAMVRAGAEDNFGLIGAGSHNVAIRAPQHRALERGEVVIGEITPCYHG